MELKENVLSLKQNLILFADNSKRRWLIFGIMLFALFFIFISKVNLSNKIDVLYGSDEWDYQTIAVNFASGNGFHVTGRFEKPEVYKFGNVDNGTYEKQELLKGITDIHRPPLYPLFIGLMYKLFGINPYLIVVFQLLLLCVVAAGLPLLGYFLWHSKGFYSGIFSGVVFIGINYKMADLFLPGQTFTAFLIFVFIFIAEKFFRNKTPHLAALMASVLAISLLFHGTMILVVGFIGIYLLIDFRKGEKWKKFKNLLVFCVVLFVILLPWHLFAFKTLRVLKHDSSVVLSVALDTTLTIEEKKHMVALNAPRYGAYLMPQREFTASEIKVIKDSLIPDIKNKGAYFNNIKASTIDFLKIAVSQEIIDAPDFFLIFLYVTVALDCHNEFITDGSSGSEWRFNSKSFYNNDHLGNKNSWVRVYNFYKHNPDYMLPLIIMKIKAAINYSSFLKLFFFLTIIFAFLKVPEIKPLIKLTLLVFIVAGLVLFNTYSDPKMLVVILLVCYILFMFLSNFLILSHEIPKSFNFIFFNIIIFTILALGIQRYFNVLDPFFILLSIFYLYKTVKIICDILCLFFNKCSIS